MADHDGQASWGPYALGGLLLVWVLVVLYFYVPWSGGAPNAKDLETKALQDPAAAERQKAVVQLSKLKAAGLENLRNLVRQSKDADVRALALEALGTQWDYDSMDLILAALDDEAEPVRGRAGVVAQRLLGLAIEYHAEDPPAKRQQTAKRMQEEWKKMENSELLRDFKIRLKEQKPDEVLSQ